MKIINATQAKQAFGELLNNAQQEPVVIQKHQKDFAILVSSARYQELLAFEDTCLHNLAVMAEQEGFIGTEASKNLLDSI
ncbi:MAG: type II toxin-antitoxin system Phd/YefM family antitoxin [Methylomonas sp.]|jgi:PHD/YefM family antitoxin component YafN of YafNO toxin-antitoxin module|uniref:type II toxin-antitoxin system Phd/YefM family antitoxin n=1 Tax=Methylomonas sp. TaxID=418 RepID=UPI0025DFC77B|nr:type II toxin-antitoxin system Phd/YefM family antitoxin [Methylomonas sp.]MCK9609132.1 type II toxin-antitoxin system Phd/YefM family antitoxin [Methylomonas sp.]